MSCDCHMTSHDPASQAEQLMEALNVYREEMVKGREWGEECRVERREVPRPKPHPLLVAMGDITVCVHMYEINCE